MTVLLPVTGCCVKGALTGRYATGSCVYRLLRDRLFRDPRLRGRGVLHRGRITGEWLRILTDLSGWGCRVRWWPVDGATCGGGCTLRDQAARQSHVRMVCSSASKRSSTEGPSRKDAGALSLAFGGSASVTARVPFVVTSMFPSWSLTGYVRRARDQGRAPEHRHATGKAVGVLCCKWCQALAVNVAAGENGEFLLHLKFGWRLLGCHSRPDFPPADRESRDCEQGLLLQPSGGRASLAC